MLCNDPLKITESKILKQLRKVLLCCRHCKWLFTGLKKLLYSWSYGQQRFHSRDCLILKITRKSCCSMITQVTMGSAVLELLRNALYAVRKVKSGVQTLESFCFDKIIFIDKVICYRLNIWLYTTKNHVMQWWHINQYVINCCKYEQSVILYCEQSTS